MSACPTADRWLLLAEDLLEPEESKQLGRHLETCPRCRQRSEALEKATLPPEDWPAPPPSSLEALLEKRRADALAGEITPLAIRLRCTYCKGQVFREEAAHCASCLAPHHDDCFREHGRCAAYACGETHRLTSEGPRPRPRLAPWLRRAAALLLGLGLAIGGLAWQARQTQPLIELSTRSYPIAGLLRAAAPASPALEVDPLHPDPNALLDPGLRRLLIRLRTSPVDLELAASSAGEALNAIAAAAEVRIRWREDKGALAELLSRPTALQIRERSALSALSLVLDHAGLEARLEAGGLAIGRPRGAGPKPRALSGEALDSATLLALLEERRGQGALGRGAVEIRGDKLILRQDEAGHRAVRALLDELGQESDTEGAALAAWFEHEGPPPESLDRKRTALFRARLAEARLSLQIRPGSLSELGAALTRALGPGIPLRFHPDAPIGRPLPALQITDRPGPEALAELCRVAGLAFEIDREGLLLRLPESQGLTVRLDQTAALAPSAAPPPAPGEPVSLDLRGLAFGDAIGAIAAAAGRDLFVFAPIPDAASPVLLRASSVDPTLALDLLLRSRGLGLRSAPGAWVVVPRDQAQLWPEPAEALALDAFNAGAALDAPISLKISARPAMALLDELSARAGLAVLAADASLATREHPGLTATARPLGELIRRAAERADARVFLADGLAVVRDGRRSALLDGRRELRQQILERRLSMAEDETQIMDAAGLCQRLERACGGFAVFRGRLPRHRLILRPRATAAAALEALQLQLGCAWELRLMPGGVPVFVIERQRPGLIPEALAAARPRRAWRALSAAPVRAELDRRRRDLREALSAVRREALSPSSSGLDSALDRLGRALAARADVLACVVALQDLDRGSAPALPLRAGLLESIEAVLTEIERDPSAALREQDDAIAELESKLEEVGGRLELLAKEGARTRLELDNERRAIKARRTRWRRVILNLKRGAAEARAAEARRRAALERELRVLEGRYIELGRLDAAALEEPRSRLRRGEAWSAVFPRGFGAYLGGVEDRRRARERAALDQRRRAVLGESGR